MKIWLKTLSGSTIELHVEPSQTIESLKDLIHSKIGLPPD